MHTIKSFFIKLGLWRSDDEPEPIISRKRRNVNDPVLEFNDRIQLVPEIKRVRLNPSSSSIRNMSSKEPKPGTSSSNAASEWIEPDFLKKRAHSLGARNKKTSTPKSELKIQKIKNNLSPDVQIINITKNNDPDVQYVRTLKSFPDSMTGMSYYFNPTVQARKSTSATRMRYKPSFVKTSTPAPIFNESIRLNDCLAYKDILDRFSPSITQLSNGGPIYLGNRSGMGSSLLSKCSSFVDLTNESSKENSKTTQNGVIAVDDDDDDDDSDVKIVPEVSKCNSLKNEFQFNPLYHPSWLDDISKQFSKTKIERSRSIEEEEVRNRLLNSVNKKFVTSLEERISKHLKITQDHVIDLDEEPVVPTLSKEQEGKVNNALVPNPPTQVLATKFGMNITRNDIRTLSKLNWLNDEVINFYMNLLNERNTKVYAMNTFFYQRLSLSGHAGLKRWTRKVDIFAMDYMPIPVHLKVHWCMCIVSFKEKAIRYYDSMGDTNDTCLNRVSKYLQDESLDKRKQKLDMSGWVKENVKDTPRQMNGSDCGMFACMIAEHVTRNASLDFSQEDMPNFRRQMILEILEGRLLR